MSQRKSFLIAVFALMLAASTVAAMTPDQLQNSTDSAVFLRVYRVFQNTDFPTTGSGFFIHPDGYVVTNQHVVSGEHRLTITLFRRNENELQHVQFTDVRIVAMSPAMDLALLKIEDGLDRPLPVVPLGSDQELRQGQTVFAVGSPLGLDRTVSQGIVSLTNRVLGHQLLIQTTTEINPGNSGGPLFNLHGEVVGVNDLKLAGIGLEGLSFAIPVSTLREFLVNRNAFAFDPRNPNAGFRYNEPPLITAPAASGDNP